MQGACEALRARRERWKKRIHAEAPLVRFSKAGEVVGMNAYSDAELAALLRGGESHLVERKRSAGDRSGIRRNICAFANDIAGTGKPGAIFIGVEDDGTCANIRADDSLLRNLAQMGSDGNILPLPDLAVERKILGGCEVAVVQVAPERRPPVRYRGRVWIKSGPTVLLASPEQERHLSERRRAAELPFDMRPVEEATLDALDADYARNRYLPSAVAADVLEGNRRSLDEQLRSLRLIVDNSPTWGALLCLGRCPQRWLPGAYAQFLRIGGPAITDPILDQQAVTGNLKDMLKELDALLRSNVKIGTEVAQAAEEQRQPDYPVAAIRQLAWNAVMHRNYEGTNAPVRVYWYADRLEIRSPGGLYGQVTEENFGNGATDYRNPLLAEAMHNLGFAQRFGMGIPLARQAMAENGNPPPEFAFRPTEIVVTARPPR